MSSQTTTKFPAIAPADKGQLCVRCGNRVKRRMFVTLKDGHAVCAECLGRLWIDDFSNSRLYDAERFRVLAGEQEALVRQFSATKELFGNVLKIDDGHHILRVNDGFYPYDRVTGFKVLKGEEEIPASTVAHAMSWSLKPFRLRILLRDSPCDHADVNLRSGAMLFTTRMECVERSVAALERICATRAVPVKTDSSLDQGPHDGTVPTKSFLRGNLVVDEAQSWFSVNGCMYQFENLLSHEVVERKGEMTQVSGLGSGCLIGLGVYLMFGLYLGLLAFVIAAAVGLAAGSKIRREPSTYSIRVSLRGAERSYDVIDCAGATKEEVGAASAALDLVAMLRDERARERDATAAAAHAATTDALTEPAPADDAEEIRRYRTLADEGIITEEEFEAKKRQLLGL